MPKALDVGDKVPSFSLPDQDGGQLTLTQVLGQGPVVVFFYPKDETAVCTKEACSFRDANAEFAQAGAQVFGISGDSVASHKSFAKNHRLQYRLLADETNHVRDDVFGVPRGLLGLTAGRVTYVLDKEGIIRMRHQGTLESTQHVEKALAIVKSLAGT